MAEAKRRKLAAQRSQLVKPSLAVAPSRAIAASLLAALSMGVSKVALAQAGCGPGPAINSVIYTPMANNYPTGISQNSLPTLFPFTVTLQPAVNVATTGTGVLVTNNTGGSITLNAPAPGATGSVTIDTSGSHGGLYALRIPASSTPSATVSVIYTGPSSGPGIVSSGDNTTNITADNQGSGNTTIDASGNLSGHAGLPNPGNQSFFGLQALAGDSDFGGPGGPGDASVIYRSGTINVLGERTVGIFASASAGSATITTLPGTTIIVGTEFSTDHPQPGVDAFADGGNTTDIVASTITINGNPAPSTMNYKSNATGIRASSDLSGDASVTYTGPGITVHGGGVSASLPLPVPPVAAAPAAAPPWMPPGPPGRSWQMVQTRSVSSPTAALSAMYLVRLIQQPV